MPPTVAPRLPTPEEVRALRARARTAQTSFRARHDASLLWPYLSQIDLINRAAGSSPVDYQVTPRAEGGSVIVGRARKGGITMEYVELPYEWNHEKIIAAEIFISRGPMEYIRISGEISEDRRELRFSVSYVPRGLLPLGALIARNIAASFCAVMKGIDDALAGAQDPLAMEGFAARTPENQRRARDLAAAWGALLPGSEVPAKLADFVLRAPEKYVSRLRPYAVARQLGLDRHEALRFCLLAVKAGFLDLSWDLICPSCRGAKLRADALSGLEAAAHCDTCNIRYDAEFDRNVEVTFRPVQRVRPLDGLEFCLQSPSHQRHVAAQLNLEPRGQLAARVRLEPGHYRLRGLGIPGEVVIEVSDEGPETTIEAAIADGLSGGSFASGPGAALAIRNESPHWRTIRLERHAYREDAATAAEVTSLQEFRDRFSAEILRPHVQIGVSNIAILFSDLKDSTTLYETRGDAPAFSLVQQHFDLMTNVIRAHRGGVIKTIGDAVMAAFADEAAAVAAALDILDAFQDWNARHPPDAQIIVKLGLNAGPCIALNLNDRLDYFGSTVNRAARVQGLSQGSDLVVPEALLERPAVRALLRERAHLAITAFDAELKGISGKQRVAGLRCRGAPASGVASC